MKIFLTVGCSFLIALLFVLMKHRPNFCSIPKQFGLRQIDYDTYEMSWKEQVFYTMMAAVFIFFLSYIFYHHLLISLFVIPLALLYPKIKKKDLILKRKNSLQVQFKDALYALASSLMAGKSIESAFRDSLKDLEIIYPEPDTYILTEFRTIVRKLELNESIEDALQDFARRSHLEDIASFVDVFIISKRSGGNLVEIIKNTSTILADKLQIKQEIDTLLAQRKFEQKVLNSMPVLLIILLSWTTGDYMAPVFETGLGRAVMTAAIILLALAYYISQKIMTIEV